MTASTGMLGEAARLAAVRGLRLLDSPPEERFDRLTRLVCQALHVPFAQIGLLDANRYWYKSSAGLSAVADHREQALGAVVVLERGALVVADLRQHARFRDLPAVQGSPFLRAFAGVPLHGAAGMAVGALSALDTAPRQFSAADFAALRDLAALTEDALRDGRMAQRGDAPSMRALIDILADCAFTFGSDGAIQHHNAAAAALFGYDPGEADGLPVEALIPDFQLDSGRRAASVTNPPVREAWGRRSSGDLFPLELTISAFEQGGAITHIAVVRDLTQRKQTEQHLRHQAFYDAVTHLPNRLLFAERLNAALTAGSGMIALLYLDLDGFKAVNDTHGHAVGDQLLLAVGRRLTSRLRPGDTVARVGGDEFALLLAEIPDARAALQLADRLIEHLRRPFAIEQQRLTIAASIGVALAEPDEAIDGESLVRAADLALCRAKAAGKARAIVFGDQRFAWNTSIASAVG